MCKAFDAKLRRKLRKDDGQRRICRGRREEEYSSVNEEEKQDEAVRDEFVILGFFYLHCCPTFPDPATALEQFGNSSEVIAWAPAGPGPIIESNTDPLRIGRSVSTLSHRFQRPFPMSH